MESQEQKTVYRHTHIPSMTMTIIESTKKGYKCLVVDPKGTGKVRKGKVEYFFEQDVKGERACWRT